MLIFVLCNFFIAETESIFCSSIGEDDDDEGKFKRLCWFNHPFFCIFTRISERCLSSKFCFFIIIYDCCIDASLSDLFKDSLSVVLIFSSSSPSIISEFFSSLFCNGILFLAPESIHFWQRKE